MKPTHPWKKGISRTLSYIARGQKPPIVMIDWKGKQRNLNLASNKKSKPTQKIMYDCHTDRKHPIFFDSVHNDLKIITFFDLNLTLPSQDKKIPPSNFGTLNPPDLASKSHTNIFLWWPKKEYIFAIAHFSCPQNQKKSLKNPPKKKNSQKTNKNYHLWGRRKKRFCLGQKFKLKWWKKLLLTYSKSTKFFGIFYKN